MNQDHNIDELQKFVCFDCWIELLDKFLANSGVEIIDRPFHVAYLIVENRVMTIKGMKQKDILDTFVFKQLCKYSKKWYKDRYGQSSLESNKTFLKGIVLIYRTQYLVNIPLVLTEKSKTKNNILDVYLPRTIRDKEDVLGMVFSPPNFATMTSKLKKSTKNKIKSLGTCLRNINHDIMSTDIEKQYMEMRDSIVAHLNNCAEYFIQHKSNSMAFAFWEVQLAVEKSFKVFLHQRKHCFNKTHNLRELYRDCGGELELGFRQNFFKFIPTDKEVVDMRYYGCKRSVVEFMICYRCCLAIISKIAMLFKKTIVFGDNTRFYVKQVDYL